MQLLRFHILSDKQREDMVRTTWNRAEAATIETCARHLDEIRDRSTSDSVREILMVSAASIRKLKVTNA